MVSSRLTPTLKWWLANNKSKRHNERKEITKGYLHLNKIYTRREIKCEKLKTKSKCQKLKAKLKLHSSSSSELEERNYNYKDDGVGWCSIRERCPKASDAILIYMRKMIHFQWLKPMDL